MAHSSLGALNSMLRQTDIEDHDEILVAATAAVKAAKTRDGEDRLTAQRVRIVALLKLDRYEEALRAIAEGGSELETLCLLEKAYALYKTKALGEAEVVLRKEQNKLADDQARGLKHVAAQVAYRNENFETAADMYRDLVGSVPTEGHDGEENDVRINLLAAYSQLEMQGKGWAVPDKSKQPGRAELEAFMPAYNAACACLGRGDFAKASVILTRARDLCQASDLGDEEKKTELIPIMVQQAYTFTKLGKVEDAKKLLSSIAMSEIPDATTKIIANAIWTFLEVGGNPYMAQRLASRAPKNTSPNDPLFAHQATVIQRNKYTLELLAQKFPGVKRATTKILSQESVPSVMAAKTSLGVMRAAAHCQLRTGKDGLRLMRRLLDSHPDDVGLLLTIIQQYVVMANPAQAVRLLEAFFERLEAAEMADHSNIRFSPGLVAVAVALYRLQGRPGAVRAELAKAAKHWERHDTGKSPSSSSSSDYLLREAGIELLRSLNPDDLLAAGDAFERLAQSHGEDREAAAGLVASFALNDFDKVQPHLDTLSTVEQLTAGVDVEALLEAGIASMPIKKPADGTGSSGKKRALDGEQNQQQPAAKKRRRNKLPKNYEEGRMPDPERWLPLRDRSTYRPKGKKGKKRAADAAQGVREEETLELAGGAGSVKVEKAGVVGAGSGAKKKKKGKK